MDKKKVYILAGVGGLILISFSSYLIYKKRRDNNAKEFYVEVEKLLNPEETIKTSKAFDINFWKTVNNAKVIDESSALNLAKEIRNSFSYAGIDEKRLFAVYRSMFNQASMSRVADVFFKTYSKDLLYVIQTGAWTVFGEMDKEEFTELMNIINKKPLI